MSANPISFAPYQTPFVDLRTGIISREWYLFLQSLFKRVGGSSGASNDDLAGFIDDLAILADEDQALALTLSALTLAPYLNLQQTAAEAAANVTPVNFGYAPGNVLRYGADATGTNDDTLAFQRAQNTNFTFDLPPGSYRTDTAMTGTYSLIAKGNPTYSGANPLLSWVPAFGGILQVASTGTYNGFVSAVRNNLPANTVAEPTAITAYGRNDNAGNIAFGLFGRADQYATTGVATNEIDSFNWSGVAASNALPPNRGFATTQNLPIAWTVAAGGNATSAIGIQVCKEGGNPQQFLCGYYNNTDAIAAGGFGMVLDADSTSTQQLTALFKHKVGVECMQFQGVGVPVPTNNVIGYVDGAGATKWTLQESGQMFFAYNQGGWGTPTNNAVINNYAGSAETLARTGQAVAQIIIMLKSLGLAGV